MTQGADRVTRHRFLPRFRALAIVTSLLGILCSVAGMVIDLGLLMIALGVLATIAGAGYLTSPTWRLAVTADQHGLTIGSARRERFHLAWPSVVKVVASPETHSCYVDGGSPATSLLVPGVGAHAMYDLEDRPTLVATILRHVPGDRIEIVPTLEQASSSTPASST